MSRFGRHIPLILTLAVAVVLSAGCRPTIGPSPVATGMQIAQATATHTAGSSPARTQDLPLSSTPTSSPTATATFTPLPPTPSCTATSSPAPPTPTAIPSPSPTVPPPTPTPTRLPSTATPTRLPPTATPFSYRFLPAGPARPDPTNPCPGCPYAPAYIVGRITDAAGNPLVGVRLVCYNEWHRYPVVTSKAGGEYDFAINQAETTWYVVVLDQTDQPISPEVAVRFDPRETCRYILDWRRVS